MFNIGGAELLVILLVALLVLGPDKLPEASKKIGNIMGELRKMSNGFKTEMKQAMDTSTEASARAKGADVAKAPEAIAPADAPASSDGLGSTGPGASSDAGQKPAELTEKPAQGDSGE